MREASYDLAPLSGYLYIRRLIAEDESYENAITFTKNVSDCLDYFITKLNEITEETTEEQIMAEVYEAGKVHFASDLRLWFKILYQILMKEENGPRIGQFIKIWGVDMTLNRVYNVRTGTF